VLVVVIVKIFWEKKFNDLADTFLSTKTNLHAHYLFKLENQLKHRHNKIDFIWSLFMALDGWQRPFDCSV
jgi:hypothetical protein